MPDASPRITGRTNEYERLSSEVQEFCARPAKAGGLSIVGLSGYGGVGKTFLLDAVLQGVRTQLCDSLIIKADASNEELLGDFSLFLDETMAPFELPSPGRARHDYFPQTRKLIRRQQLLTGKVDDEINERMDTTENVRRIAKILYKARPFVRQIPKIGEDIDFVLENLEELEADEWIGPAIEILGELEVLSEKRGFFQNPLTKRQFANLVRNPYEAFGEAYHSDLSAILAKYRKSDRFKLTHRSIKGLRRCVLIVDDFETTGNLVGQFLVNNVLAKMKNAEFPTLAIIVGRDSLEDAHPDFDQHLGGNITLRQRLEPFTEEAGVRFLVDAGYTEERARDLYKDSRGFPFILKLFAETMSDEGKRSAVFFQRFYERTTRWMTTEQREWLKRLVYLDRIDKNTVKHLLPGVNPILVVNWFIKEASIRDINSEYYTVNPYIRHMIIEHQKRVFGEAEHKRFSEFGEQAMCD